MAKATVKTEKKIVLELTQEEAQYLWALTQNYLVPTQDPGDWEQENARTRELRQRIFMSLADEDIHCG